MSLSPQGPGWWQASDGQWYPPEAHPEFRPSEPTQQMPAPSPYGPPPTARQPAAQQPAQQSPQYGEAPYRQQTQPGQAPYGQPQDGQAPSGQPQYGQPPYGQPPYGQPQYGQPQYPQQPPAPQGSGRKVGLIVFGVLAIAVVLVILASVLVFALGSDSSTDSVVVGRTSTGESADANPTEPDKSIKEDAPDATEGVEIVGPTNTQENQVVSAAIADIQQFWTTQMPDTYGVDYQPVEGGFYSWSPGEDLPPCADSAENISGNAFYCGNADDVAWDDTDLIPHLYETYGDLSVAIVFAHEWGHAIQARANVGGATVTLEQQADCFAGSWVQHVRNGDSEFFTADGPALDQALAGFLEIADTPGTSAMDPNAHGSAFDRINSFQEGLDDGATACAAYTDDSVGSRLVELEFQSQEDFDSGGNAPYADIIDLSTKDLEDYWSKVSEQKYGTTWTPLAAAQPFDGTTSDTPACGDADTSGYTLFYCADGRFIAYDDVALFPQVYDSLGDFAVAALYGSQYSLAAQETFGVAPEKARDQNLMADCMTGTWAASVFLQDRPDTAQLILSPGDFDEAIKVLLAFGSNEQDGGSQGTGFERVAAFRDGVIKGLDSCVDR